MDRFELARRASVCADDLDMWIAEGWLLPWPPAGPETFRESDLARARLIVDLRCDMGVNDDALPIILDLVDQLCALRGILQPLLRQTRAARESADPSGTRTSPRELVLITPTGRRPMTSSTLSKSEWSGFFANLSRMLQGKQAEIEVLALDLGDEIEAEWLPLLGLAYDPKNDLVEVALQNVDHMIRRPTAISVDIGEAGLLTIEVAAADGTREIVRFRDPLLLPPPG